MCCRKRRALGARYRSAAQPQPAQEERAHAPLPGARSKPGHTTHISVVDSDLNAGIIDEVLKIGTETAFATARKVARLEGLPGGLAENVLVAAVG